MNYESVPEFPFRSKTNLIYTSCIAFFLLTTFSIPFVKIDVSINSPALIRPTTEVSLVHSLISGRIKESYVSENKKVSKGDVLLVIESESLMQQEKYALEETAIHKSEIKDLNTLILHAYQSRPDEAPLFYNSLYLQTFSDYRQKLADAEAHFYKARKEYERQHKLYIENVIPEAEFETFRFELQRTEDAIRHVRETHLTQWQNELRNLREKLHDLELKLNQMKEEKRSLTIRSPINGTLQNIEGIYPNGIVFANQEIGIISPDTSLIAVALVSPGNIGLIQKGMPVRLMVEAFNYNHWGVINGSVIEIPTDVKIIDNKPVFEVRCSLDREFLQLKNGHKGFLKKGMTTHARLIVTKRSIWEMLYDKVDNWINPNTFKN